MKRLQFYRPVCHKNPSIKWEFQLQTVYLLTFMNLCIYRVTHIKIRCLKNIYIFLTQHCKPKLQLRRHSCIFSIFSCLLTIFLAILEYYLKVHWFKIFNFWYCMKSREKGKAKAVTLPLFITPPLVCHCVAANNSIESLSNSNLFATTEEAHVIYF